MRYIGIVALLWAAFGVPPALRAQDVGGNFGGGMQGGEFGGFNFQAQDLNVNELMTLAFDRGLRREVWGGKQDFWRGFTGREVPLAGAFGDGPGEADTSWVDECDK